ncbi:GGDEF domain-containing protein [Paenibacillus sp. D2_2]|uniref:GGDEF domain-containing protein n=1 Tax=Paenibacillus sp. D2_2 TaxID=3073092 RepID=UPI0028160F89|nr:GGDEF domain-containing protein [Paenibacillus sp. D2_2]WMT39313.1 GGDEF domain-containing protein [Paenibacillus sp. D2_2]
MSTIFAGIPSWAYVVNVTVLVLIGLVLHVTFSERSRLRRLAYRDTVTGLYNRNGLDRFWKKYNGKGNLAVMSLDLDYFKEVNDTFGHHMGDMLLRAVGKDLKRVTNKHQQAYRVGGDEFMIILKNCEPDTVEILAGLILGKICRPYYIEGQDIAITGSIGISMADGQRADQRRMQKEADVAMYRAKRLGKNRYTVYKSSKIIDIAKVEPLQVIKKKSSAN